MSTDGYEGHVILHYPPRAGHHEPASDQDLREFREWRDKYTAAAEEGVRRGWLDWDSPIDEGDVTGPWAWDETEDEHAARIADVRPIHEFIGPRSPLRSQVQPGDRYTYLPPRR